MKKYLLFAVCQGLSTLLSGCYTSRLAGRVTSSTGTVHYQSIVEHSRDTVIAVPLPRESIVGLVEAGDSVSIVETLLAISEVRRRPDGMLIHSVRNKPDTMHIRATVVDRDIIVRDSVGVATEKITVKTVERHRTLWWLWIAGAVGLLTAGAVVRRPLLQLFRRTIASLLP